MLKLNYKNGIKNAPFAKRQKEIALIKLYWKN